MRKSTLIIIPFMVAFVIVYAGPKFVEYAGFLDVPRWSLTLIGMLVAGIVIFILVLANPHILAWRKARGRDIEEEQRYETEHGMIRLKPVDETERNK
jgi:hypothetical protein